MDGDGLVIFPNEYVFFRGRGYGGVGFLCWISIDNRCSVCKRIVHGIGIIENMVVGLFKIEGGECRVPINRISGRKIIRLGSCCCYFVWFCELLSLRWLSFVMSLLWWVYKCYIKVITFHCILPIPIEQLLTVHIPVGWLITTGSIGIIMSDG